MYGQNPGTHYLTSQVKVKHEQEGVKKRIGVSVVKDEYSSDYIVRLVNMLPATVNTKITLKDVDLQHPTATRTLLTGAPTDQTSKPVITPFELSSNEFDYTMPAYSFTVIRVKP